MVHEGLAQGGEPREETSAKEVGLGPGCGAPPCRQPLTYPYAFIQSPKSRTEGCWAGPR